MRRRFPIVVLIACLLWVSSSFAGIHEKVVYADQSEKMNNVISFSAGWKHVLAIRSDGTLWAWGNNFNGQLGDSTTNHRVNPVQIGSDSNWRSISAGSNHSLAIRTDGTLWGWGDNTMGQLGMTGLTNSSSPIQLDKGTNWVRIAAGSECSYAIKSDGTLWRTGCASGLLNNKFTQFGKDQDWAELDIANNDSAQVLAIKRDGSLWGWGNNGNGQVGVVGNYIAKPTQVGSDTDWSKVRAGWYLSMGQKKDGSLWTWGSIYSGTDQTSMNVFPMNAGTDWSAFAASTSKLLVRTDGTLWAYGYAGDGYYKDNSQPEQVGNESDWVDVDSGFGFNVALKRDGTLWSWGYNPTGQLGNGKSTEADVPQRIGNDSNWSNVSAGWEHTMALRTDGSLWGFGNNNAGQISNSNIGLQNSPIPTDDRHDWISVAASSGRSTFGIRSDGTLWAWGYDQQRLVDTDDRYLDMQQVGTDSDWKQVQVGLGMAFALKTDGTLWAWGGDYSKTLFPNQVETVFTPVQIGTDHTWTKLSIAKEESSTLVLALKQNGSLWVWATYNHIAGNAQGTGEKAFVRVGSVKDVWIDAAAGIVEAFMIKQDGTLWAIGGGNAFINDKSRPSHSPFPIQIGKDNDWATVSAGITHVLLTKTNGTLWAFGKNYNGVLGTGNSKDALEPVQIGHDTDWKIAQAGYSHSMAIKQDGSLWGWGNNTYGQLGNGAGQVQLLPGPVNNPKLTIYFNAPYGTTITGKGVPGNSVRLLSKNKQLAQALVDPNGDFTLSVPAKSNGTAEVRMVSPAGATVAVSTIVVKEPLTLVINPIRAGSQTITGTTQPNAMITFKTGNRSYSVQANNNGSFTAKVNKVKAGAIIKFVATESKGTASVSVTVTVTK